MVAKLNDMLESLAQGLRPLGWIVSFSLGEVRVPADEANKILIEIGENPGKWLTPISEAQAYRSALSQFSIENKTYDGDKITEIERWEIERIAGDDYLTHRVIHVDEVNSRSKRVAKISLDEQGALKIKFTNDGFRDSTSVYIDMLAKEYDERKTHYYSQHFRYIFLKMLEDLDSVRWSGNSTFFVPVRHTQRLECIESLMSKITPFRTTSHRSGLLCVPIPDMGVMDDNFKLYIEDNLMTHIAEESDQVIDELKKVLERENSRESTRVRRIKESVQRLERLSDKVAQYSNLLGKKMPLISDKIVMTKSKLSAIVDNLLTP